MKKAASIIVLVIAIVAQAAPDRPAPKGKAKQPAPVPAIAGECVWGFITQDGRKVSIDGHERWTATGKFRADGSIHVVWYHIEDAKLAPAVYRLRKDGSIIGVWGWDEDVAMQADGTLAGKTHGDTLRHKIEGPIF